jgi:glucose uptake protein
MLLPTTYALTMALLLFSMMCWGSWANTLKMSRWRFELFYIDFSLGSVLAAVVAAFTFGSMGTDLSVNDTFLLVGKRQIFLAFAAGCIFNLANMLLVAAIEMAGMSVAFPVGIGLALIVGVVWSFAMQQVGNAYMLFGGCLLVLVAVVLSAVAHGMMETIRRKAAAAIAAAAAAEAAEQAATEAPAQMRKKKQVEEEGPGVYRGVWLALAAGLLMGSFYPVMAMSTEGELGITNPFAVALIFSIGILISTFIYNLYFMNLPVKGLPISFFAYFTGTIGQHGLGLMGGMIWMAGACANFAAAAASGEAKAGPAVSYALGQGATFVSLMWGLIVWKEFAGATSSVYRLLLLMSLFFLGGLALVAIAPLN